MCLQICFESISSAMQKTAIALVLPHWSCRNLPLSHRCMHNYSGAVDAVKARLKSGTAKIQTSLPEVSGYLVAWVLLSAVIADKPGWLYPLRAKDALRFALLGYHGFWFIGVAVVVRMICWGLQLALPQMAYPPFILSDLVIRTSWW